MLVTEKKRKTEQLYPGVRSSKKTSPKPKGSKLLFYVIIIVVLGFIILTRNVYIVEANYRLQALERKLDTIQKENEKLKVKLAELKSYSRIEHIAKNKLNMVKPSPEQVVVISLNTLNTINDDSNAQVSSTQVKKPKSSRENILSVVLKNIFD